MRKKKIAIVLTFIVAGWFFTDAMLYSFRARDPVSGRRMGCYTQIELWLGVQSPTGWIRDAEMYGSLALFVLAAVVAFLTWRSEKKQ
jgi:hypothetical protein